MTGDEYQRTAKALARETGMADPSVRRIEEQLLSAMSSGAAMPPPWREALRRDLRGLGAGG